MDLGVNSTRSYQRMIIQVELIIDHDPKSSPPPHCFRASVKDDKGEYMRGLAVGRCDSALCEFGRLLEAFRNCSFLPTFHPCRMSECRFS